MYPVAGPGNDDLPRLQGFAQHLQHLAIKFRQFIEEQHTVMGECDFPGLRFRATPTSAGPEAE